MSKLSKFLSIAMDLVKGQENKTGGCESCKELKMEELTDYIGWLEELCNHKKVEFSKKVSFEKKGDADFLILDETGKGVPAQIKFFPLLANETSDHYNRVNGSINMIREITDENGKLAVTLPAGTYFMEISKGSEYKILNTEITIVENQTTMVKEVISPIINLKKLGWYCGDLHHHSIYSSPVYHGTDPVIETPKEVCLSMMAMGATYGALSDHHNTYNHREWSLLKNDAFIPILSKEISTSNGHVMALGVDEDIIYQIPKEEKRSDDYLRNEFVRITNLIKASGGLPQINHPKDHSKSISWNPKYDDMLSIFETMEIWNGSNPMSPGTTNEMAFQLWRKLLEEGRYIPATSGSDTHNILANDYHEIFDRFCSLAELIKNNKIHIPERLKEKTDYFIKLYQQMPLIEKWAETNLTSAGVRTYVHVNGKITENNILESLKKGHSFLTNGPILIPEINGKIPGDNINEKIKTVNIELKLLANRPLTSLTMYFSGNRIKQIPLKTTNSMEGCYDYSQTIFNEEVQGTSWIFFVAADDCTNMAITNPIFFNE